MHTDQHGCVWSRENVFLPARLSPKRAQCPRHAALPIVAFPGVPFILQPHQDAQRMPALHSFAVMICPNDPNRCLVSLHQLVPAAVLSHQAHGLHDDRRIAGTGLGMFMVTLS